MPCLFNRALRTALCVLVAAVLGLAGDPAAGPAMQQPLGFDRFGTREGLSSSWVRDLIQDPRGFLWIATSDGLCRYDGIGFRVYGAAEGLADRLITRLFVDRQGRLWVGLEKLGVARYDPEQDRFLAVHQADGAPLPTVTGFLEDRHGTTWIGTLQGLYRMQPGNSRPEAMEGPTRSFIVRMALDRDGAIWLSGSGLLRFDPASGATTRYSEKDGTLPHDGTAGCFVDRAGAVWAGDRHGRLLKLDPDRRRFRTFLHLDRSGAIEDAVNAFREDRLGRLWVVTAAHGFLVLDAQRRVIRHERSDPAVPAGLGSSNVTCILEDRSGVIWLGTDPAGLHKLPPLREAFQHVRAGPGGLRSPMVRAVRELADGRLLVGTQGGGLHVFDGQGRLDRVLFTGRGDGLQNSYALHVDRRGRIWAGGTGEIARVDPRTFSTRRVAGTGLSSGLGKSEIQAFLEDRQGRLWVAGSQDLYRLDPERCAITPMDLAGSGQLPHILGGAWLQALAEDRDGDLWLGSMYNGLLRLDRSGARVIHRFHSGNGLKSDFVTALHEDRKGRLWVATKGGGLSLCLDKQRGSFRHFGVEQGLPHPNVYGILEEAGGALWLSTDKGLCRLDPDTGSTRTYRATDGLQDDEFNRFSFFRSASGRMYFGGLNGLNAFHPDQLPKHSARPEVAITRFRQFGEPIHLPPSRRLELSHAVKFFAFEFAVLDFLDPARNRCEYRLEGFDARWYPGRVATFTSLAPGDYTLHVRACNADGVWNEDGIRLPIRIAPPWWRTGWAYLLGLLGGGAALVAVFRLRTVQLRRDKHRLEALVAERTREVAAHAGALERANRDLVETNASLTAAMAEVKTLQGLIPICAQCKKIRDDGGIWNQIEGYLSRHTDARFSHGICPDCAQVLRAELEARKGQGG